ncbi:MAG: phage holin family protein [Clostridia bacterium]|nr:phage holin family protein [Clostridia bacterium]
MTKRKSRGSHWEIVLVCCTLAVPTIAQVMGIYGPDMSLEALRPALLVGAALGFIHILLRPLLRLLFAPIGCLTLGLFGLVIDVALIYAAASVVEGFVVPGLLYAVLTAMAINAVCAVAAGRR